MIDSCNYIVILIKTENKVIINYFHQLYVESIFLIYTFTTDLQTTNDNILPI